MGRGLGLPPPAAILGGIAMKRSGKWLLWAAFVMIGLPFLAVKCVPGDAGMAVCFVLFYGVNPLFSLAAGWAASADGMPGVVVPPVVAGLFLVGVWAFFDLGEPAFLRYAEGYACGGWAAVYLGLLVRKSKKGE